MDSVSVYKKFISKEIKRREVNFFGIDTFKSRSQCNWDIAFLIRLDL